jgi:hypothetical protein
MGATTLSITTFSNNDTQHNGPSLVLTLSIGIQQNSKECHYCECRYAKCRDYLNVILSVAMLNEVMLSVVRLSVVMLSVVMLSVVAPKMS